MNHYYYFFELVLVMDGTGCPLPHWLMHSTLHPHEELSFLSQLSPGHKQDLYTEPTTSCDVHTITQ